MSVFIQVITSQKVIDHHHLIDYRCCITDPKRWINTLKLKNTLLPITHRQTQPRILTQQMSIPADTSAILTGLQCRNVMWCRLQPQETNHQVIMWSKWWCSNFKPFIKIRHCKIALFSPPIWENCYEVQHSFQAWLQHGTTAAWPPCYYITQGHFPNHRPT